ncbi:mevalonate kinase [Streptomyces sp. NPDC058045]|uniref:mevalonate kinase n=1 Tax=Streptomyces sp. NPDC058045 TaxID=3346311 RepID=UPI0036E1F0DD
MTLPTSAEGVPGSRSVGRGRAHGKAILLGEHAVVYGAPALALPVPQLAVTASAGWSSHAPADGGEASFTMTGSASRPLVAQAAGGLQRLVAEFKRTAGVAGRSHVDVVIDCAVPPGRGLGSSAACARAIILALADLFGRELDGDAVFDLVQTVENVNHGRSSGVDAVATGAAVPLKFTAGEVEELRTDALGEALVLIADSGDFGRTKDAVEMLRTGFQRVPGSQERFVGRATELTRAAVRDLADGRADDLGRRLTDYHELLSTAGLSTGRIDAWVETALAAGSPGAKITGGGLGGCMIALARGPEQAQQITRQLNSAGASQTWAVPLGRFPGHAS